MIAKINKFSTETQAPFNSPFEGGRGMSLAGGKFANVPYQRNARITNPREQEQAPFNSPEGGKCSPPSEGLGEANAQYNARITNPREQEIYKMSMIINKNK